MNELEKYVLDKKSSVLASVAETTLIHVSPLYFPIFLIRFVMLPNSDQWGENYVLCF